VVDSDGRGDHDDPLQQLLLVANDDRDVRDDPKH